jgi:hypothetical protein
MLFPSVALVIIMATGLMAPFSSSKKSKNSPDTNKDSPNKKESPKKKDLTKIRFTEDSLKQKRKPAYYLKIVKLRPDFELIFIEHWMAGTDGYGQKLYDHIRDHDGFRDEGVLVVAHRRISQENNGVLCNARDTYPRRVIVRLVNHISTHESRLAILQKFRAFLMLPENNKFGYDYVVNDASDLTPANPEDPLEPLDHYLQDDMIVNMIVNVYENTDQTWYSNNTENATDFFTGPTFPQYAIDQLGYPADEIPGQNGIAPGFNMPDEERG